MCFFPKINSDGLQVSKNLGSPLFSTYLVYAWTHFRQHKGLAEKNFCLKIWVFIIYSKLHGEKSTYLNFSGKIPEQSRVSGCTKGNKLLAQN